MLFLTALVAAAFAEAPYPPSGWRPAKAFLLPVQFRQRYEQYGPPAPAPSYGPPPQVTEAPVEETTTEEVTESATEEATTEPASQEEVSLEPHTIYFQFFCASINAVHKIWPRLKQDNAVLNLKKRDLMKQRAERILNLYIFDWMPIESCWKTSTASDILCTWQISHFQSVKTPKWKKRSQIQGLLI